jgi:hypothetical protein
MTADAEPMLFAGYPDPPAQTTGEKLRAAVEVTIARGFHPLAGAPLYGEQQDGGGETCGTCAHRFYKGGTARGYPKCALGPITGGPATDVLARWPACWKWQAVTDG